MKSIAVRSQAVLLATVMLWSSTSAVALATLEVRSIDGSGNNETHIEWGSVDTQLLRVTSVDYFDSIAEPRGGSGAVSPRAISNAVAAQTVDIKNARGLSDLFWTWGQFLDHDIDLTDNGSPAEPYPISVPFGDTYFDPFHTGTQTIGFNRSIYDPTTGTDASNPRQQINQITAFIDGSNVYGSDSIRADALRTFSGGLLKTSTGNLLPFNTSGLPNAMGTSPTFFLAGDVRANEQPGLTALHTLFVREHNRIAAEVALANPLLTDEEIYQAARRKVGALLQVITYNEFLPALFGSDILTTYAGYDSTIDPGVATEFSTSAYRLGHSMISPELLRLDASGLEIPEGHVSLMAGFFNPTIIQQADIDPLLRGLAAQVMQEVDTMEIDALRNFLFGPPGAGGFDLVSLNIQRGRDHGITDYNQARRDLGLAAHTSFNDITSNASLATALETVYNADIEDIDLWVAGLAEDHLPGSSLGETFTVILKDQFTRLRDGDRFWYQNIYTGSELDEIHATTLKDIIERNTSITGLQSDTMFAAFPEADLETSIELAALTLSGSSIHTEVSVKNNGPLSASGISLTVPVPANTTFTTSGSTTGCTENTGVVTCSINPLSSESSAVVDLVFEPAASACFTTITIESDVTALEADTQLANNWASQTTFYACPGPNDLDLSVSIGSSPTALRGNSFTSTATLTNNGPASTTGAALSVSIPSDITINTINQAGCSVVGSNVVCSDLTLNNGDTFNVEIEYTIAETSNCPRDVTLTAASDSGSQIDYFAGNNSADSLTKIECEPENDLSISIGVTGQSPLDAIILYNVAVQNNGPATAASPFVTFTLPLGASFIAGSSSAGCAQNGSVIECPVALLANGEGTNVIIGLKPLQTLACGTTISTQATISSAEKETNTADNTSSTVHTELTCTTNSGGNGNPSENTDRSRSKKSQSRGSTSGKGTREAGHVLAMLCKMNGIADDFAGSSHFQLVSRYSVASRELVFFNTTEGIVIDDWSEGEKNVLCSMKRYMEDQDPRKRQTKAFKDWLVGALAEELHHTKEDVRIAIDSESFCL